MRWILLTLALLGALPAKSEARLYGAAELESLLAPVALQPDAVLWNVLEATTAPQEVMDAAAADADDGPWMPAVRALLPYPDLLDRMAESPAWLFDLGNAYLGQRNDVLAAVQVLRQRAYGAGYLQSDPAQVVQHYGSTIAVVPAVAHYYSVRYYNPIVVYGPAWRPVRHVHWRPWVHRPVVHKPVVHKHLHVQKPKPLNGAPSPAARMQQQQAVQFRQYHRVPESRRQPIVQQHYPQRFQPTSGYREAKPSAAAASRETSGGTRRPPPRTGRAARPS
ncbi:MAG TPA: DUF3300 domain-containing protein [Burkholderiales bacterium]|nr:DUF3300 domain-containing protein [Burkholderiales bacterium]